MARNAYFAIPLALLSIAACSSEAADDTEGSGAAATTFGAPVVTTCVSTCADPSGPDIGPRRKWKRAISEVFSLPEIKDAKLHNHRGRDMIVMEGQAQWVIGKFAYGLTDKDLKGEEVDIYVERGCAGQWEKLGTATTTDENQHPTVEGVDDSGGRVYFEIPYAKALPVGRHRIRLVVAGDLTSADLLFEVVNKETPVFVSDVDGTLTSEEFIEFKKLLEGGLPRANPEAAAVFTKLTDKGYRPVYLTARPEWLTARTHEFLATRGFPPGIVHTTTTLTGALWSAAAAYKARELQQLTAKGISIRWAFGNQESDSKAYEGAGFGQGVQCIFYKLLHPRGGRGIGGFGEVLPDVSADPVQCVPAP